jgi:hypothetical protein
LIVPTTALDAWFSDTLKLTLFYIEEKYENIKQQWIEAKVEGTDSFSCT